MVYSSDIRKTQGAIVIIDGFLPKHSLSEAMYLETPDLKDIMSLIVFFRNNCSTCSQTVL